MKFISIATLLLPLVSALAINNEASQGLSRRTNDTDPCRIVSTHTVVSGDTLNAIAASTDSSVAAIVFVNANITNPNFISIGQVINIPATECNDVAPPLANTGATTSTCAVAGTITPYVVIAGDTLTIIAERYHITLAALEAANPQIANFDVIDVNDKINIPVCES